MALIGDIEKDRASGQNHIDALLNVGPDWNYMLGGNTLYYTFSLDDSHARQAKYVNAPVEFTAAQKVAGRIAMAYLEKVTGVHFVETADTARANFHLWGGNLLSEAAGISDWYRTYRYDQDRNITQYDAQTWVYIDTGSYAEEFAKMAPGTGAYQVLLHELGHSLGLKHPFDDDITLPAADDNTLNTIMSYTYRGPLLSEFRPYDLAALNWLYGGDGLGGKLGINSAGGGRYLTGSARDDTLAGGAGNDLLEGLQGNDQLDGGAGLDVVRYSDERAKHTVSKVADGYRVSTVGQLESDTLHQVERLVFADMHVALDIDGVAGTVFRMYQAALGRAPDAAGMGYWMGKMDNGLSIQNLAAGFMDAREFKEKFGGSDPSDELFITKIYNNVLHRAPDEGGFNFYMGVLGGGASRIGVLTDFSESPEYRKQVIELIGNGIDYQPYV